MSWMYLRNEMKFIFYFLFLNEVVDAIEFMRSCYHVIEEWLNIVFSVTGPIGQSQCEL